MKQHSFLFSRDKAIFYGSLNLTNAITLGNVGKTDLILTQPVGDDKRVAEENAKHVNYKELKGSGNGTMFYDSDNNIVVIKVDGKWRKLKVEALPKNIKYDF